MTLVESLPHFLMSSMSDVGAALAKLWVPVAELGSKFEGFAKAYLPMDCVPPNLRKPILGGFIVLSAYLTTVQLLRYRRVRRLGKKYGKGVPGGVWKGKKVVMGRPDVQLSPQEAQQIMHVSLEYDMPGLTIQGLTFALFKTYAIPTISQLLLKTEELSSRENVSRRVSDTGILVTLTMHCPFVDLRRLPMNYKPEEVDSRSALAIARMNWLHGRYPTISNDDYLYTLSLAVLEPLRWGNRHGWRKMLPIEEQAYFALWKDIGKRMNIKEIPDTLDELLEWSLSYQEVAMVPAPSNFAVANHTITHILSTLPEAFGMRAFMEGVAHSVLEDEVRIAMMLPDPPLICRWALRAIFTYFRIKHRYLSLPRFKPHEYVPIDLPKEEMKKPMPRMHPTEFGKEPWYKPEPKGLSWAWERLLINLHIKEEDDYPSSKYKKEGFRVEELGPIRTENQGHAEVFKMAAEMQGCPVMGPWARKE